MQSVTKNYLWPETGTGGTESTPLGGWRCKMHGGWKFSRGLNSTNPQHLPHQLARCFHAYHDLCAIQLHRSTTVQS